MPFGIGPGELFLIAVAALLLFGPKKLPEMGKAIGESIGALKKAVNDAASNDKEPQNTNNHEKTSKVDTDTLDKG